MQIIDNALSIIILISIKVSQKVFYHIIIWKVGQICPTLILVFITIIQYYILVHNLFISKTN